MCLFAIGINMLLEPSNRHDAAARNAIEIIKTATAVQSRNIFSLLLCRKAALSPDDLVIIIASGKEKIQCKYCA